MLQRPVYMDYNATTPCDDRVVAAMMPYFSRHFGNAASKNHVFGWQAAEAVGLAREQVAQLIASSPEEVVFTSGATEAANLAIKGIFETYRTKGNHIITCNIEHKAVLDTCAHLEKQGADVTYLKVGTNGLVDLGEFAGAFKSSTILVAIMYANNEIGTIMPVREISAIAKERGALFFSDATQAIGKLPVNVANDGIDVMALSGHKIYGPKGVGALYVRRRDPRVKLSAQIDGGGHERGMRSGTLNVPGIVGLGKASEICSREWKSDADKTGRFRDQLEAGLSAAVNVSVNGDRQYRLPNVSNICFGLADGEALMAGLNGSLAVSTGSACMSASLEPSYVLKALGLSNEMARSSLRFSLGRFTTKEEIEFAIGEVATVVNRLRVTSQQIQ